MDQPNFVDDLFDNPAGDWVQSHADENFQQRYLRQDGPIYCETLMTVHGANGVPPDANAAIDLICGPWDWWEHGRIADFTGNADGSSDQILSPVWWFITRVALHIFPAVNLPDVRGRRVPLLLSENFSGPSSMDVYSGNSSDVMIIRGRFHGVEYHVPLIPTSVAEGLHLEAESGTMPDPFPKGTGWLGLLHKLEARSPLDNVLIPS
jgi:hypothetical protein